jgi:hypothetical protein
VANERGGGSRDEVEALEQQLEVERGLREAADAENERLVAQIEAYAEDMATLFAEQQGHNRDGLAAEVADLRSQLADETAQREVVSALHKRSAKQARELSEQMAVYGKDLARAYRGGGKPSGPWWRRPAGLIPIGTTVAGLLLGAGGYAAIVPTPTPFVDSVDGPAYGPPAPPELAPSSGIMVASGGRLQPLGAGAGLTGSTDAAALAATAAAGAFGASDASLRGTPDPLGTATGPAATGTALAAAALGLTPTPTGADPVATAMAAAGAAARLSPSPSASETSANLAPTVTALAATATAVAATSTVLAGTAIAAQATVSALQTAAARPPATVLPTTTPTVEVVDLSKSQPTKRCRFELLIPPLSPGQGFAIQFQQRNPADVVVLWSDQEGQVSLSQLDASGAAAPFAGASEAAAGRGVFAHEAPPGGYLANLAKAGPADESRVALFYDDSSACFPEPKGQPVEGAAPPMANPPAAPTEPAAPTATAAPANPSSAANGPTSTPGPPATATPVPQPSPSSATQPSPTPAAPSPTTAPRSPTPAPPTATPVRPYVDCRPYLRGPSKIFRLDPLVWTDKARTVLGTLPLRTTLTGPGVNQTANFTADPNGAFHEFPLGGFGTYHLHTEADGADLDPDCFWEFDHDIYT